MATPAQGTNPGFPWHTAAWKIQENKEGKEEQSDPTNVTPITERACRRLLPGAAASFDAFRASCFTTLIIAAAAKVRRVVKQIH